MSSAWLRQMEIEMTRVYISYLAWTLICFMVTMFVLYMVIRAAIRDGIRDSGLVQTWQHTAAAATGRHTATDLPDMRADR